MKLDLVDKITSEQLGRAVTIGEVDFKPWTLELTLRDVSVASAGTGTQAGTPVGPPQLHVARRSSRSISPMTAPWRETTTR